MDCPCRPSICRRAQRYRTQPCGPPLASFSVAISSPQPRCDKAFEHLAAQDMPALAMIKIQMRGAMMRPEFRKILLDQRGAAVILWSCFVISIPVYIVIARNVLGNPNIGSNRSVAEAARLVLWFLTVIDLGYYVYWRKRNLAAAAILRDARSTKLFRA